MSQGKFGDNYCLGVIRPSFNSISHQITSKRSVRGGWEQTACSARWRSPCGPLPPGRTCVVWLEEPESRNQSAAHQVLYQSHSVSFSLCVSLCPSPFSILADLTTTQGWGPNTIKYWCVAYPILLSIVPQTWMTPQMCILFMKCLVLLFLACCWKKVQ